ncbi:hypothetical protein MKJ01_03540 [Chryseobacterium sp. SSA4.19]|uniref:hypothetical protein n=1 Tax=Chryseobacterium sp. SSA4.19 TaxID=2919915 RepID=UPI001F4D4C20|nr:hypothetical protein [Chryseobacterium sp. SSA4.19]MCJ8152836.1 hypothetical protein [Chryseobacterium sp. SSA4.19]
MKNTVIHTIPVSVSFLWLFFIHHTWNPVSLKGPYFLTFYLMMILGFYISVFIVRVHKSIIPEITFYFMISIFILGMIKLIKGISLGKPVGFLIMILMIELTVILYVNHSKLKKR